MGSCCTYLYLGSPSYSTVFIFIFCGYSISNTSFAFKNCYVSTRHTNHQFSTYDFVCKHTFKIFIINDYNSNKRNRIKEKRACIALNLGHGQMYIALI